MDSKLHIERKNRSVLRSKWIWKLAYKDARKNFGRLFLFVSSIIIGIAALVAIDSFNQNLQDDINNQSKELLGADLEIDSRRTVFDSTFLLSLDSLDVEIAGDARFASMVYFPKNNGTRLIQAKAIEGAFPFYGNVEMVGGSDIAPFRNGKSVLIDESLAIQYDVRLGDSLKLGKGTFLISGIVTAFPGTTSINADIQPTVYLPYARLEETGLIQYGSRVNYHKYLKVPDGDLKHVRDRLDPLLEEYNYRIDDVEERKEDLGRGFGNLYKFFNLLSFVALILGCIGVASSVYIYVREKKYAAAVLRCMGASGWQIFFVFFIQILAIGIIGSVLGVVHGILIQYVLPLVVSDFIPIEVEPHISWLSAIKGLVLGLIISTLFSVLPLVNIRFVAPLIILRETVEKTARKSKFKYFIFTLIVLFPWIFSVNQTGSLANGSMFFGSLVVVFGLLWLVAKGLIRIVQRFFPSRSSFVWRQSLSNLFRPNNQTVILVIVIGLGAFLLSTLTIIQDSLLGQVEFAGRGERSNTVLFDIQPYQKDQVVQLTKDFDLPIQQLVPIVTTRISSVRDSTVAQIQEDTTSNVRGWALNREYRVTYRDSLIESEKILEGAFQSKAGEDSIFISVSDNLKEGLKLKLKDEIVWNVQGVDIKTYVGSVRQIDWRRVQTNFMVVFPEGVLENAPQFFVLISKIDDKNTSARFQQELVRKFPNVSAIDLTLILETVDQVFDKVGFVIRFMALFSVLAGLLVLSGAVINSKYARLKENVLLRTLGAARKQLLQMTIIEFAYLGTFAGLSGSLLALIAGWALSVFFFEILFFPNLVSLAATWISIAFLTVLVGWFNTRSILNKSPLEILRKEV
jgi:putative ABC transport system permease protein